ncbi:MAG: hypothetical protein DMG89_09655 [Acidobacteria bacterium]|nr:MAG: hypothetical protein DMG89_09655 [Acidobacteriota bacterium]
MIFRAGASNSGQEPGGVAMRFTDSLKPEELMGPDLLSEIVIAMGAAVLFFFLMLTLIAALAAK